MGKRRSREERGKIELTKPVFEKLAKKFPRFEIFREDWGNYRSEDEPIYLPPSRFTRVELVGLQDILKREGPAHSGVVAQLSGHLNALDLKGKAVMSTLPVFETALTNFVAEKIIEGWVFVKDLEEGTVRPML